MASGNNPFGGFVHRSPLASGAHDPLVDLGSHCVREWFGPTVQSLADLLERCGGDLTLGQITMGVLGDCSMRVPNAERDAVVTRSLRQPRNRKPTAIGSVMNRARGPEHAGYVVDVKAIHAALLVLMQHSIVTAVPVAAPRAGVRPFKYSYNGTRARLLPRYPRFVEYTKKAVDEVAATLLEEIAIHGRMSTEEAAKAAWNALQPDDEEEEEENENVPEKNDPPPDRPPRKRGVSAERILQSFQKLVEGGFVQIVATLDATPKRSAATQDEPSPTETPPSVPPRKRKRNAAAATDDDGVKTEEGPGEDAAATTKLEGLVDDANAFSEDPHDKEDEQEEEDGEDEIVRLLSSDDRFRHVFAPGAVWRLHVPFFHDSLRAFCLGRLVAERYADKVKSAGSIVTAALKLLAFREHSPLGPKAAMYAARQATGADVDQTQMDELSTFSPDDLLHHLPPKVLNDFKNQSGGARANLSKSLAALAVFSWPQVILEVEDAQGHAEGGKFEVALRPLVDHLRGRVLHQVVHDRHGDVAARICAALEAKGYLEADGVAEAAMVPVKDAREILHQMYRSNYISSLALVPSKQHNPAQAIYVWGVQRPRLFQAVLHNVGTALYHLRLRRQHEVEVGKDWMDRADAEEEGNDVEKDKLEYSRFCQGLERLDHAILQLDETLMVLQEF